MYKAFGQPGHLCVAPILLSFSGVQPHCRKKKKKKQKKKNKNKK
jgi:hypothetical protein